MQESVTEEEKFLKTQEQIQNKLKTLREFKYVHTQCNEPAPAMLIGMIECLEWVMSD